MPCKLGPPCVWFPDDLYVPEQRGCSVCKVHGHVWVMAFDSSCTLIALHMFPHYSRTSEITHLMGQR
ncbi:hypothetical protein OESDEN_18447 [Oesophagostomum dentatum]|uniref:Uncharacterized protein n=1 Tax=Oesophagostomum dentatum TaxID=61180 RepID=A0A0B1SAA1_OESDE|nr:hypothetical protein OESDEN_18447 [Oesophagostomum dentatum]